MPTPNPLGNNLDPISQEWRTPPDLFRQLNDIFRFEVDAAATDSNHLLPKYWTAADSGLSWPWTRYRVWCNPPWGLTEEFVRKAPRSRVAVLLISANSLASQYVVEVPPVLVCYPPARVKYLHSDRDVASNPAHGSALLVYGREVEGELGEIVPRLATVGAVYRLAAPYIPPPPVYDTDGVEGV